MLRLRKFISRIPGPWFREYYTESLTYWQGELFYAPFVQQSKTLRESNKNIMHYVRAVWESYWERQDLKRKDEDWSSRQLFTFSPNTHRLLLPKELLYTFGVEVVVGVRNDVKFSSSSSFFCTRPFLCKVYFSSLVGGLKVPVGAGRRVSSIIPT